MISHPLAVEISFRSNNACLYKTIQVNEKGNIEMALKGGTQKWDGWMDACCHGHDL